MLLAEDQPGRDPETRVAPVGWSLVGTLQEGFAYLSVFDGFEM